MRFTATKIFSIEPIGDIAFIFNKRSRRKGKQILVSDVDILPNTNMTLDEDTYKALMKAMKEKGSDLLTDGTNFYTTFGQVIGQINHPQFRIELELHRELFW